MFVRIFNLIKLSTILIRLKFAKRIDHKLSSALVKSMFNCGAVPIKFGQWYAMRYDMSMKNNGSLCKELIHTLENCPEHSFEYTKKIYYESFGCSLKDSFILESEIPIASGSVGQVYKGTFNETPAIMKVLHPNLMKDYNFTSFVLKVCNMFLFKEFNVKDFLKNIKLQFDYNNEAKNLEMIYKHYENDSIIVVPKLLKHSKDIIIMTYEYGVDYSTLENPFLKQKVALSLLSFQRQNSCIYGYIHGDLHNGNWKVRILENEFKLVIYDYGIVYYINPVLIHNWIKAYQNQDFPQLIKLSVENSDDVCDEKTLQLIIDECCECLKSPPNMTIVLKTMIPLFKYYNIHLKEQFLSLLISFALTEKVLLNVKNNYTKNTQTTYVSNILDIIAFCKTKNTCLKLCILLENELEKLNVNSIFENELQNDAYDVQSFYNSFINE